MLAALNSLGSETVALRFEACWLLSVLLTVLMVRMLLLPLRLA